MSDQRKLFERDREDPYYEGRHTHRKEGFFERNCDEAWEQVKETFSHPGRLFAKVLLIALLGDGQTLEELVSGAELQAGRALNAHPENELYTQLAQSLVNWCALMDRTVQGRDAETARIYAQTTMCTLCRELRRALSGA